MPRSIRVLLLLAITALLLTSCALHSTAKEWHGRVGPDGKPVYLVTTTHIGVNLLVFIPIVGGTNVPIMIEEVTDTIAQEGGDNLRVIQTGTENYWYGFPPFTWIVTPVISDTIIEYQPSEAQFAEDEALWQGEDPDA